MEQLFAPWRIEWVERDRPRGESDECVFCSLPGESGPTPADRDRLIVARGEHAYVLLNNYPYNPGHAMIVPYGHEGRLPALADDVALDMIRLRGRTVAALEHALGPDGFNVGMNLGRGAGGSIPDHLHAHVVPRWIGDTNFMAVIDDTTVIVEALEDTFERLQEGFVATSETSPADDGAAVVLD